ncbi:lipase/esterase family protein [Paracoccidioides lutzii Pb01]|uniref:Lipase/esterase family protein n=1 Tax=Paracoccidioides lutzii (strain ATCC MYA-826 / Pb01) TaxID=502779 RepID=C1GRZ4_PARBA|nr:lipase/esterase family protein [Paracoccidioides lutzii Pb01]EEH38368.2 lipase/esterase family protein [Paracoccidioides lutzii Pb01]
MPFNALTVGAAVAPTVLSTLLSHYTNRKAYRKKHAARISYHEGLDIVRRFLYYSSLHTVEDLQSFTSQRVPYPRWINVDAVVIPEDHVAAAADLLIIQLGPDGLSRVGGSKWWQWRGSKRTLQGEWIETVRDLAARQRQGTHCNRIMLYIHGGAYYFGSLNSHRYQIQRHARKLRARVFARKSITTLYLSSAYRLAPQFPFPCGLHDCLATYLYLLSRYKSSEIIIAGDSAGAGMALSVLVTIRDQRLPLPAGAILISPWVDLTHSFPSVSGNGDGDYIPPYGFMHRPSKSWPPPSADELDEIVRVERTARAKRHLPASSATPNRIEDSQTSVRRSPGHAPSVRSWKSSMGRRSFSSVSENYDIFPNQASCLEIEIDGKVVEIKDQIHMYTTNELLSHPLVSPVLQPSLGGLPPMFVLSGGSELLRDEQIYLAHKATDPHSFLPSEEYLNVHDPHRNAVNGYPPTFVQLQVWDDVCHVAPTLSFTQPAKYMFRSIAQFGAWALARAQQTGVEIPNQVSEISSRDVDTPYSATQGRMSPSPYSGFTKIGKAGDPLPPFQDYMIRQRVDIDGNIYPLAAKAYLTALHITPEDIGIPKPGPVRKWLRAKEAWDRAFSKEKSACQQQRLEEIMQRIGVFRLGEFPPPCALASRKDISVAYEEQEHKKNHAMWFWSLLSSKYDTKTMENEKIMMGMAYQEGRRPSVRSSLRKKLLPHETETEKRHLPANHANADPSGQPLVIQPIESQPGFADHSSKFMDDSGAAGQSSPEYTDDASAVKDGKGFISPIPTAERPDTNSKNPFEQKSPNGTASSASIIPIQNGIQDSGGSQTRKEGHAFRRVVDHSQLLEKCKEGIGRVASVSEPKVRPFLEENGKPNV